MPKPMTEAGKPVARQPSFDCPQLLTPSLLFPQPTNAGCNQRLLPAISPCLRSFLHPLCHCT